MNETLYELMTVCTIREMKLNQDLFRFCTHKIFLFAGYSNLAVTSTVTTVSVYCDADSVCYGTDRLTDGNADPMFAHDSCSQTGTELSTSKLLLPGY